MNKITTTALLATLLCPPLHAADIAGEMRNGGEGPETSDGGFLEVGISGRVWTRPQVGPGDKASYGVVVSGEYRYKGLFVEAINGTADGVNVGYQLWNDDEWIVDFIGFNGTAGSVGEMDPNLGDTARSLWLMDRNTALTGAGLRATRYFDDYILQFRVLNDVYHSRGNYGSARVGRSWQYRNWNFHAMAGVEFYDSKFAQHVYGVSAVQASNFFPEYRPGAVVTPEFEVGVTYPVNQNWVFRATARHTFLPDAVTDNALYADSSQSQFFASLSYVF